MSSSEHEISAETSYNQQQQHREEQLGANAADGICPLVPEQTSGTDEARCGEHKQGEE
jgi:hypothetical protein